MYSGGSVKLNETIRFGGEGNAPHSGALAWE